MSGAVDLSGLKERSDAQRSRADGANSPTGTTASAPPAGAGSGVIDVSDESFETEVLTRSARQLVVVDLWAEWCGPCKQLSPVLERLAATAAGRWVLAKIDVDASPRVAQAFGVQSIPTVVAIAGGQPVAAFSGVRSEAEITSWLDEIFAQVGDQLPGDANLDAEPPEEPEEPEDPAMTAANQKLDAGDVDGALADYRAIAAADPNNVAAASAARNLEFVMRARSHDPAIVDTAAPGDVDAQLAAADVELLSQQPDVAFDRIIAVVASTTDDDRTRARTRLLELFELFDPAEPFVVAARRKLARALY